MKLVDFAAINLLQNDYFMYLIMSNNVEFNTMMYISEYIV